MCGIVGYVGKSGKAQSNIIVALKMMEYRGYDSWGLAYKSGAKTRVQKYVGKVSETKQTKTEGTANSGIGHTRWATHGGVSVKNAHPHTGCTNSVVIAHNGIIENYELLKYELSTRHKFRSDTDTEVFAHLVEEGLQRHKDKVQAVRFAFNKIDGKNAFLVYFPKEERILAIKKGSPLVYTCASHRHSGKEFVVASDPYALLPYSHNLCYLEDGNILVFGGTNHILLSENGERKGFNFIKSDLNTQSIQLNGYEHFMLKEIEEQPKTLDFLVKTKKKDIVNLARKIQRSFGSYFIGCGTASYVCMAGTYLFSKIANEHTNYSIGSEFSYLVDFLKKDSFVVAVSQSGETMDTIISVEIAKSKGVKIASITNAKGSTLWRESDVNILINVGPEICVLATKSVTAQVAVLILLSHSLKTKYEDGVESMKLAINEVKKIIQSKDAIKKLAKKIVKSEDIYVLGRGLSYPVALEGALKIKEVSYIHAEGFAAGELKHGVISLIDKGTPVIVFNPDDETYKDTLASAHEVKARGAYVIGISSRPNEVYDEFLKIRDCNTATIIPQLVTAQLLGYYLSVLKGLDPDKPRNLAKSVTVK